MNIFGLEIKRTKQSASNKYLQNIVFPWQRGKEYATGRDPASLIKAYRSWVYVCARRNSTTFASSALRLYVAKKSTNQKVYAQTKPITKETRKHLESIPGIVGLDCVQKAIDVEEVVDHRFLDLMRNVNPFMNRFALLELSDLFNELTGLSYWYLLKDNMGLPIEIWVMPVDRLMPVPDPERFISHYIYRHGLKKIEFNEEDIVRFAWPDPKDPYSGMSPLAAVADAYNINTNMNVYENTLFSNSGRLEGYFSAKEPIDDNEFDRLKDELKDTFTGVSNAGKSPLLDSGVEYKHFNLPPKELGFLKGREWTQKEIYAAFDNMVALDDPNANKSNVDAAERHLLKFGISPRHRRFEEKLNERVMPMFDDKLFVAFDNCVPEDQEFIVKKNVEYVKVGISLRNEVRAEDGREPYEGGDIPIVPGYSRRESDADVEATPKEIEEFSDKVAKMVGEKLEVNN